MVNLVSPVVRSGFVPFSFTEDRFRQPQPVQAILDGFEYPGEVVVAPNWQCEFGEPLSRIPMFWLVLLQTKEGPSVRVIADRRRCERVISPQMILD